MTSALARAVAAPDDAARRASPASRSPARRIASRTEPVAVSSQAVPGGASPRPMPRSAAARPAGSLRSRSSRQRRAASGGVPANSGCAVQRSANVLDASRRRCSSASASSRAPARGALGVVVDAGRGRDEHEPGHALGRGERDVQRDAPAERVAAQRERARARRRARRRRSRRTSTGRARRSRSPWPRRSGASGSVAFARPAAPSPAPTRGPCRRSRGAGRGRLGHRPSHLDRPAPTPTCSCARSSTSCARCGMRRRVHVAGLALARRSCWRSPATGASRVRRTSTSAPPASSRSGSPRQTGRPVAVACTSRHGGGQLPARR